MKDRIPKYPGRVTLTPVEGQANTFDMVRADEPVQEGTPLNKATLLTDKTAALFGLGEDATVDKTLGALGAVALLPTNHVWKRRVYQLRTEPVLVMEGTLKSVGAYISADDTVYYAASYTVDYETGVFTLNDPTTSSWASPGNQYGNGRPYLMVGQTSGAVLYEIVGTSTTHANQTPTKSYTASPIIGEVWEIVMGNSEDSYPHSGIVDGYEYEYSGNAPDVAFGARIETGSYVGTGASGAANACELTFSFAPKIVWFSSYAYETYGIMLHAKPSGNNVIRMDEVTTEYKQGIGPMQSASISSNYSTYAKKSADGKTLSWYHPTTRTDNGEYAGYQMNKSDRVYSYIAIG